MSFNGLFGKIFQLSEWIAKLIFVNIIWVLFTLLGFVILGIFPSSVALFSICRRWINGEDDFPILKTFWEYYRKHWKLSNMIGFVYLIIGVVLYVDLIFFSSSKSILFVYMSYLFQLFLLIYLLAFLYAFPVFVHFEFNKIQYILQPFLLILIIPFHSLILLGIIFVFYLLLFLIPGLMLFMGIPIVTLVIMWISYKGFRRIEVRTRKNFKNKL